MGITYYSVFKNSNGDVGVGTTSPTAQSGYRFLQVNGSTSAIIETTVGGTRIGGFDSTASALYVGSIGSYPVIFRTAVDEKMRISANGNVGIGSTSPAAKLDIRQTSAATGLKVFANDTSTAYIAQFIGYDNSLGDTTRMVVQANGSVGIGTTSPTARLDVSGGGLSVSGWSNNNSGTTGGVEIGWDGNWGIFQVYDRVNANYEPILINGSYTMFYVSGAERARLNSSGNFGIGTTSPGYLLDVNGNSRIGSNTAQSAFAALNVSAGAGSATTYRDIDIKGNWAGGEGHAITANHGTLVTNIVGQIVFQHDSPGSRIKFGRLYHSGDQSTYPMELISDGSNAYLNLTGPLYVSGNVGIGTTTTTNGQVVIYNASGNTLSLQKAAGAAALAMGSETTNYGLIESINAGGIRFYTGNGTQTEKLRIDVNGNVGIGTSSPGYKLDVVNATTTTIRIQNTANTSDAYLITQNTLGSTFFGINATGGYIYNSSAIPIMFYTSGVERMRIDANGNVGIGSTSPTGTYGKLSVAGGIRILDDNNAKLEIGRYSSGASNSYIKLGSNSNSLRITNNTDAADIFTIENGGNVGIGTTSPSQKLEVVGGEIKAGRVNSGEEGGQVSFGRASDNATGWYVDVYGSTSTPQLRFVDVSNSSVRMVINQSGNLGIGTSSPTTKLEVIGDIATFANGADTITRGIYIANAANTRAFNFQLNSGGTNLDLWSYNSAGAWARRVSFNYDGNVGIGTTAPSSTLYVSGNVGISGNITKGGGSFLIEHPDPAKQGWKLQHSFVESPTVGDNIYRYEITINETLQGAIELPNYWKHLNENPQIWINPVNHFGIAYGEINENISSLTVFANSVGKYNILLIGTRKDPTIKKIMADFAVERKPE